MTPYGEAPGGNPAERPVERRLRQALAARAGEISVSELRPADPPGPHVRGMSGVAWLRTRRFALPLAAGLAAAATVIGFVVLAPGAGPARQEPPAAPPEFSTPGTPRPPNTSGPTPQRGTPTPEPSASPSPGGSSTPSPSVSSPPVSPSRSAVPPSRGPTPSGSPRPPSASSAPPTGTGSPSAARSATSSEPPRL
ncbi:MULTISPECIES: hypothetical protein [unclassified Streptomyces]|uniref:hypothetical protein n=1 Tax=unclassified Streptomyces TaxID=2593676 RepID=UPI0022507694|nr:hypothetical protein [Streptomyces sp. NBC_01551]MCX4529649.1 hypothetical protein [Streptomyces sp. NBC_01551]